MNFSRFASLSSSFLRGLKKIDGTESIETMVAMSAVQLRSSAMVSILEREGSRGELDQIAAQLGELASVIEGAQGPELVHEGEDVVLRGRVHEVEVKEVLDAKALEEEDDVGEVGALGLWDSVD